MLKLQREEMAKKREKGSDEQTDIFFQTYLEYWSCKIFEI